MSDDDHPPTDTDGGPESDSDGLAPAEQRRVVRERYGSIANGSSGWGDRDSTSEPASGGQTGDCCGSAADVESAASAPDVEPAASAAAVEPADSAAAVEPVGSDSDVETRSDDGGCCGPTGSESASGSDGTDDADAAAVARELGYDDADLEAVVDGANLGLGCGNPTAIASLEPGQTVLDLGSGGGFDCFLAGDEVGDDGAVIGVDMTPAMVETARENAVENDASNVSFRLGEIEHLPVADGSVDVVISNCVVNLSPDKPQVFREAFRVLRPGGRLAISDVVLTADLPVDLAADPASVAGCVAGAATVPDLESMLADAGFVDVSIEPESDSASVISEWDADRDLSEYIVSATIEARKPQP